MKKSFLLFLSLLPIISCSKEHLSCNPEVERWAKMNIEYYSNASREELVNMPLNRVRAIYRGFSDEKKANLWLEKINSYSSILEGQEKESYLELKKIVAEYYCTPGGKKSIDDLVSRWEEQMRSRFGWDDETLFFASCTWLTYDEYILASLMQYQEIQIRYDPINDKIDDCECIYNIGCPGGFSCEKNTPQGCNEVVDCGIVGTSPCKGICM